MAGPHRLSPVPHGWSMSHLRPAPAGVLRGHAVTRCWVVDVLAAFLTSAAIKPKQIGAAGRCLLYCRLGNVTVGPLMSQSSSSSSINGRVTKQIVLLMPVYGAGGDGGTAQVAVTEGPQGRSMQISVSGRGGPGEVLGIERCMGAVSGWG